QRRADAGRVAIQEPDQFRHGGVTIRVSTFIGLAGQTQLPVRGEQPQRIPALMAPGIRYRTAFDDHMVNRQIRQAVTHGQARVAGADDNHVYGAVGETDGWRDHDAFVTSTQSSVGLVTMSNTAERFCGWATTARISSSPASASISYFTRIPSKPLRTSPS